MLSNRTKFPREAYGGRHHYTQCDRKWALPTEKLNPFSQSQVDLLVS